MAQSKKGMQKFYHVVGLYKLFRLAKHILSQCNDLGTDRIKILHAVHRGKVTQGHNDDVRKDYLTISDQSNHTIPKIS